MPTRDPIAQNATWSLVSGAGMYAVHVERVYGSRVETDAWPLSMN